MIEDSEGVISSQTLNIQPQAATIWKGLGGTFDTYMQIICEFVDNSIANLEERGGALLNMIHITVTEEENHVFTVIEDTGTGIGEEELERCLTIGEEPESDSLRNEHGWGLKHALAAADPDNRNWSIHTKTESDIQRQRYRKITAPYTNEINQDTVDSNVQPWPGQPTYASTTGTLISFKASKEIWSKIYKRATTFDTLVQRLKEKLGHIYANILANNDVTIRITSHPRRGSTTESDPVVAIKPVWTDSYAPEPATESVDLGEGDVAISYHFGRIQESQQHKLCYRANMRQQGAEIRLNGRLIADNLFTEIWGKEPNNQYNHFRCLIDIECTERGRAPETRTHKDGFRETEKYAELLRFIKQKHPNPVSEYTPSTQTEASLRDLVYDAKKTHLPDASVEKELNVFTELDVDVKVDLYIQHQDQLTIYECKKDATRVLDLYQLRMYWDGCVYDNMQPTKGILLASHHSDSVHQVIRYLNEMKDANDVNYNFEARTWNQENVQYPQNPNLVD